MRIDPRSASAAVAIGAHALAAFVLLQLDAVRRPLLEAVPLMVHLVTPPKPEPPPPPPEVVPPKPKPVARQPAPVRAPEPPPILASANDAPGTGFVAAPPRAEPAPIAPPAPPAPPRIVPPSFDAAYLKNPAPAYPLTSKRRGEQGRVVLRVHVLPDGSADLVELRASSGHERLDQAALEAVRQWRFVPARQGEQPVAAWVLVPIVFSLEN